MYNWSFLFVVLHKPTLLLSTFNDDNKWPGSNNLLADQQ